ncbi:MAG: SDR family NAD(P)-dependent oxidoreductase [Candidatus Pseudobacter hemicellulosilyticus]|uniref:SDR family NAD(P)-dependent oxidoreductase n=1 Tax=Candidatus Pseudobacter hemicellulosilyticus TaxID=3121375 RepID=A0AAJ5WRJ5_9BACT|nr:MAG: SDR family NAD(P)-dependent oxidoreductase [Pseudobacter sp.]
MFFSNKVIWLTGASSGIGEALAGALLQQNAKLILSSRREAELLRVSGQSTDPQRVAILPLDLEKPETFEAAVQQAIQAFGQIDYMIHNGGISQRSLVVDTQPSVQRKVMEVDYFSYIELTRLLLPHFKQQGRGHFVVMSSVMGKIGTPMRSAYAAAKHALHGFFDCLRAELWQEQIQVTIITPGYIRTNVTRNAVTASGEKLNKEGKDISRGYPPEKAAQQILKAIRKGKYEKYVGRAFSKEWMAIQLMRLFPTLAIRVFRTAVPD